MDKGTRLQSLDEFSTVARRLSFTTAADELNLDASVLSRRIAKLEARLGVRLLQRTTRRVALTEAGAVFLDRCIDVLARLDDAEAEVSRHVAEPTGILRLGVPNLFGQRQVAPLIPEFMSLYPGLRVELSFNDSFVDLVDLHLDAAVRIGALEAGGDLVVKRLAPNRRVLCASPAYLEANGDISQPSDLLRHKTLHFTPLVGGNVWRLRGPGGAVDAPIDPVLRADNIEALRLAAIAGAGVTLLASFVAADDLAAGRLVRVMRQWHPEDSSVSIVYPNAPYLPRKVRVFLDFIAERFAGTPPWDIQMGKEPRVN